MIRDMWLIQASRWWDHLWLGGQSIDQGNRGNQISGHPGSAHRTAVVAWCHSIQAHTTQNTLNNTLNCWKFRRLRSRIKMKCTWCKAHRAVPGRRVKLWQILISHVTLSSASPLIRELNAALLSPPLICARHSAASLRATFKFCNPTASPAPTCRLCFYHLLQGSAVQSLHCSSENKYIKTEPHTKLAWSIPCLSN